jgi:hypothetical protein
VAKGISWVFDRGRGCVVTDSGEVVAMLGAAAAANGVLISAAPRLLRALNECTAALGALRTQVEQMKGMFPDADGTIREALQDGRLAQRYANSVLADLRRSA